MSGPYGYYVWKASRDPGALPAPVNTRNTFLGSERAFDITERRAVVGYLLSEGVPFPAARHAVEHAWAYDGATCLSNTHGYTVALL